jgi:hypothetical protein
VTLSDYNSKLISNITGYNFVLFKLFSCRKWIGK